METTKFNQAQQHILQMMSYIKNPEALQELEQVLSDYFARKVDEEIFESYANE